jgi:hypothetical protein
VTANTNAHTLSILLGSGTGGFGTKTDFATGVQPVSIAAGDFNSDGKLDLATANIFDDTISIRPGTGLGSFAPKTDITAGCSTNPPLYCPGQSVTREQMAAFLVKAFSYR